MNEQLMTKILFATTPEEKDKIIEEYYVETIKHSEAFKKFKVDINKQIEQDMFKPIPVPNDETAKTVSKILKEQGKDNYVIIKEDKYFIVVPKPTEEPSLYADEPVQQKPETAISSSPPVRDFEVGDEAEKQRSKEAEQVDKHKTRNRVLGLIGGFTALGVSLYILSFFF